jgi:hypothetical protein
MAGSVEATCSDIIKKPGMSSGCNTFVQAVAKVYGKDDLFVGNADSIRTKLNVAPFKPIGKNPNLATSCAMQGELVIGALSKAEATWKDSAGHQHSAVMGHVVVVVPGGPSRALTIRLQNGTAQPCRGGYPYCYQGAANPAYRFLARTQVDAVFPSHVLNDVYYAYLDI